MRDRMCSMIMMLFWSAGEEVWREAGWGLALPRKEDNERLFQLHEQLCSPGLPTTTLPNRQIGMVPCKGLDQQHICRAVITDSLHFHMADSQPAGGTTCLIRVVCLDLPILVSKLEQIWCFCSSGSLCRLALRRLVFSTASRF